MLNTLTLMGFCLSCLGVLICLGGFFKAVILRQGIKKRWLKRIGIALFFVVLFPVIKDRFEPEEVRMAREECYRIEQAEKEKELALQKQYDDQAAYEKWLRQVEMDKETALQKAYDDQAAYEAWLKAQNPYTEYQNVQLTSVLQLLLSGGGQDKLSEYYSMVNGYIFYHTIADTPDAVQFVSQRQDMLSKIDLGSASKNVRSSFNFFSANQYVSTNEVGGLDYIGDMKNDMPDGVGILRNKEIVGELVYQGNFKEGRYHGYGILYQNGVVLAEGEFREGEFTGKGNVYGNSDENQSSEHAAAIVVRGNSGLRLVSGEFKDMKAHGQIVVYVGNMVVYQGECDNGKYDGQGILYNSETGDIVYKGHFCNGKFDGEGTLYNADGEVERSGKWKAGGFES